MNNRDFYYTFDDPIPYKNLLLYPVQLKDFYKFQVFASCYFLEKNSKTNIKYISMPYLQFLYETDNVANNNKLFFDGLLRVVLKKPTMSAYYGLDENGKAFFSIDDVKYDSNDFTEIKNIIVEQNNLELPDETIQKEVRDKMEEARRYKQRISGNKIASLEEQIIALGIYTGWTLDYIQTLTIRKFIKAIRRSDHILTSKIYLQASLSGMVEFKDKSVIKHWLSELDTDKNKDIIVDVKSVQNKIDFSDAKK
jgi:hypothetical protein